jgi:hypothetical protein
MATMKFTHLIVISLTVGALLALAPIGHRGYHLFPVFVVMSGFVLGVGALVNKVLKAVGRKIRRPDDV